MVVDDEPIVAEDLAEALQEMGCEIVGIAADGERAFAMASEHRPDIICMDIVIQGDIDGVDTAARIKKELGIPSIFLSAYSDGAVLERAKQCDPLGYLVKPYDMTALRASFEVACAKLRVDRELAAHRASLEDQVRDRTAELRRQVGGLNMIAELSTEFLNCEAGEISDVLAGCLGRAGDALGYHFAALYMREETGKDEGVRLKKEVAWARVGDGPPVHFELEGGKIGGREAEIAAAAAAAVGGEETVIVNPVVEEPGSAGYLVLGWSGNWTDSWEFATLERFASLLANIVSAALGRINAHDAHERLQRQLIQSQKMEAIGNLTGGIAHDFNNMLVPILGYCGLLKNDANWGFEQLERIEEISRAAESSAALTRQLLAFSRKQILSKAHVSINEVVEENRKMICRMIGEDYKVDCKFGKEAMGIYADKGQITQVLMNLCINARDAMPKGGKIRISTSLIPTAEIESIVESASAPAWVRLQVEDSGKGMDEDTVERIFEPFFSTKGTSGTGLGLSVVHGIVKQHGGELLVESQPGVGTRFDIYFPIDWSHAAQSKNGGEEEKTVRGNGERILVVEDEPQVKRFVSCALRQGGYEVVEAADYSEGTAAFNENSGTFDLILSDAVLPDGNGVDLINYCLSRQPQTKTMLSTGYADRDVLVRRAQEMDVAFLQKPYTLGGLLRAVREVLD